MVKPTETASVWAENIPATAKLEHYERARVERLGGDPPIRVVPQLRVPEETEVRVVVKIKLTDTVTEAISKFAGGTAEDAVRHVRLFWDVEQKLGFRASFKSFRKMWKQKAVEIDALDPSADDYDAKKELKQQQRAECHTSMTTAKKEVWALWERLLHPSLISDWQRIVSTECETDGYIARDGVERTGKRGKTLEGLLASIRRWLLRIMKPDAAERERRYMQVQIVMPSNGQVKVGQFVDRLVEMNGFLPYLPTLKDAKGSPQGLARGDVPFTDLEMCQNILMAVPYQLATAYWAQKGAGHYPTDVETLREDLSLLEPEFGRTMKLTQLVRGKKADQKDSDAGTEAGGAKSPAKKQSGKRSSEGKPTPHKKSQQTKPQRRVCQRCAQWSKQWMHTHATEDCRKWTKHGEPKDRDARSISAHHKADKGEDSLRECFAQMRKDQKKLFKLVASKKARKSYRDDSDSEMSE